MSDSSPDASTAGESGNLFGPRRLNLWIVPGVSNLNVYTLLFGSFFGIAMMSFVNVSQAFLFEEVLKIPTDEQASLAGQLTAISEVIVISIIGLIGSMSDKIGRKPLYVAAFVFFAIGYVLYPFARSPEELLLYRAIFAIGLACNTAMLPSVANDYPMERSRGKMIAVCFTLNGLGFILIMQPMNFLGQFLMDATGGDALKVAQYWIWTAAGICLVVSFVLAMGLKSGPPARVEERDKLLTTLKVGIKEAKRIRVALAYAAAVVARGDMAVLSAFFVLYMKTAGLESGLDIKDAMANAIKFYVIIQVFALCWLPVLGFILDRIDRVTGLAFAMVLAGVGYASLFFLEDPMGPMIWPVAVLIGMGEMSANLASLTLIGSEAPLKGRGAVIGLFSLFGAIGILGVGLVGGQLGDMFGQSAPFALVASANGVILVLSILVLKYGPKQSPATAKTAEAGIH
ncbi:MAG: MFS transporter [Gammaproteobacteria bacterium]|jgi:MFS family permease|nr:MFS transporter [Gammaproteobacteria bacterium]MDP6617312.1 MFS transporter [Gammaproteobacteria bacterium]MDP6694090.1 MFS transporter [Gammaproteobacteria bacterium]